MFWDEENEEYCKYRNGRGHGDVRCPLCCCPASLIFIDCLTLYAFHSGELLKSFGTILSTRRLIYGACVGLFDPNKHKCQLMEPI